MQPMPLRGSQEQAWKWSKSPEVVAKALVTKDSVSLSVEWAYAWSTPHRVVVRGCFLIYFTNSFDLLLSASHASGY